jgi:hypothetical protein
MLKYYCFARDGMSYECGILPTQENQPEIYYHYFLVREAFLYVKLFLIK